MEPRLDPIPDEVDCVIVGGGIAGLSAALNLGRMRRSVLIVDERDRFLWRHMIQNYLGFPDGISASELRRLGARQAARYGVHLLVGHVAEVSEVSAESGPNPRELGRGRAFRVRIEPGRFGRAGRDPEIAQLYRDVPPDTAVEVTARSIVLATGVMGHFPDFPGRDRCVGVSLFWCIHCDGYESSGKRVAVVGSDEEAVETALDLLDFTDDVTLVAGRAEGFDVPAARLAEVTAEGIPVHACAVAEYRHSDGVMESLLLADPTATVVPVEHLYTVCRSTATNALARSLGVALEPNGQVIVDATQHTNVEGVFAAGDLTSPHNHQVSAAVHEGNEAAASANYFLYRPVQRGGE